MMANTMTTPDWSDADQGTGNHYADTASLPDIAALRSQQALGHEAAVLIADGTVQGAPMRMPPGAWALLITAADRSRVTSDVVLLAGLWQEHEYPPTNADGDVIVELLPPADDEPAAVDVRMTVADQGCWFPAGTWSQLDHTWPAIIAPTAATTMAAVTNTAEAERPAVHPQFTPVIGNHSRSRVTLRNLVDAQLINAGDRLVYRRPGLRIHRTAHVTHDGMIRLDDGRVFSTPAAATTALGSPHQNGWVFWRRVHDDRPLREIRETYINHYDQQ